MHIFIADAGISVLDMATQHTNKQTNVSNWTQAKDTQYLLIYWLTIYNYPAALKCYNIQLTEQLLNINSMHWYYLCLQLSTGNYSTIDAVQPGPAQTNTPRAAFDSHGHAWNADAV